MNILRFARLSQLALLALILVCAAPLQVTPAASQVPVVDADDTDADGIPDQWERLGHGPLDPRRHHVSVGHHDLILVAVRRPGLSAAIADEQLRQVRDFYAAIPLANPDGATGINVIVVDGNTLPASDATAEYRDVYTRGFPVAWRGIAHGYLLANVANAGGQTASTPFSDWSAGGYDWHTIAHELGHQIGLAHSPPGSGISPLWPSIMSYAYSYHVGDHAEAVRFSTGAFGSVVLHERSLDERLPFSYDSVSFLAHEFGFTMRADGAGTLVDWNRNGVLGEHGVAADINDAYAVGAAGPRINAGFAAGAPVMRQVGARLYLVYPTLPTGADAWTSSHPAMRGARLMEQEFNGSTFTAPRRLVAREPTSDASKSAFGSRLAVAYTAGVFRAPSLPIVGLWNTSAAGLGDGGAEAADWDQLVDQAIVAEASFPVISRAGSPGPLPTRPRLFMFTWMAASKAIRAVEVTDSAAAGARPAPAIAPHSSYAIMDRATPLLSDHEIAAAFDPLIGRMLLVGYASQFGQPDRIRISTLRMDSASGHWTVESTRYVGTLDVGAWGNSAPTLVLDSSLPIAGHSQMSIYARGNTNADLADVSYLYREIADRTQADGWRIKMMIDGWNTSPSPPAAALYNGAHTFAIRWNAVAEEHNRIAFYPQTGIEDQPLIDWNEVEYLRTTGMHASLQWLRDYYHVP